MTPQSLNLDVPESPPRHNPTLRRATTMLCLEPPPPPPPPHLLPHNTPTGRGSSPGSQGLYSGSESPAGKGSGPVGSVKRVAPTASAWCGNSGSKHDARGRQDSPENRSHTLAKGRRILLKGKRSSGSHLDKYIRVRESPWSRECFPQMQWGIIASFLDQRMASKGPLKHVQLSSSLLP